MNEFGITARELASYLASGAVGYRKQPNEGLLAFRNRIAKDIRNKATKSRRDALVGKGLTCHGKKRKRAWQHLDKLTPEQRKIRLAIQKRASRERLAK